MLEHLIDRKYILDRISQEEIFERYMEVRCEKYTKYCNPLRNDRYPACNFFWCDNGKVLFKDWGHKNYDCFDMVQGLYNLSFQEALQMIAADFGIGTQVMFEVKRIPRQFKTLHPRRENAEYTPIQVKRKSFLQKELSFWNFPDFTVTEDLLQRYRIFSISHYWFDGRLSGEDLKYTFAYHLGYPDKWQVYRPFAKNKRYKFRQSSSTWVIGLSELDETADYVICTKSYKDWFCLKIAGFNAVCVLSEEKVFTDEEVAKLKENGRKLILLYDNDETGVKMSNVRSEQYDCSYILYPLEWEIKDTYDAMKKYGVQYVSDFLWQALEPVTKK